MELRIGVAARAWRCGRTATRCGDTSLWGAAMENKGLNVFNTAYVLAKPSTGPRACAPPARAFEAVQNVQLHQAPAARPFRLTTVAVLVFRDPEPSSLWLSEWIAVDSLL